MDHVDLKLKFAISPGLSAIQDMVISAVAILAQWFCSRSLSKL